MKKSRLAVAFNDKPLIDFCFSTESEDDVFKLMKIIGLTTWGPSLSMNIEDGDTISPEVRYARERAGGEPDEDLSPVGLRTVVNDRIVENLTCQPSAKPSGECSTPISATGG